MKIPVDDILVSDRLRKGAGDVGSLAASLEQIGLLNPIVITKNLELVAGYRRLSAAKFLKWTTIEARYLEDETQVLEAEIHENEFRQDFSPVEIYEAGVRLEALAKQQDVEGRVRDLVARQLRIGSGRTWARLKAVMESGYDDLIEGVEDSRMEIGTAYNTLRRRLNPPKAPAPATEVEMPGGSEITIEPGSNGAHRVRTSDPLFLGGIDGCLSITYEFSSRPSATEWAALLAEQLESQTKEQT